MRDPQERLHSLPGSDLAKLAVLATLVLLAVTLATGLHWLAQDAQGLRDDLGELESDGDPETVAELSSWYAEQIANASDDGPFWEAAAELNKFYSQNSYSVNLWDSWRSVPLVDISQSDLAAVRNIESVLTYLPPPDDPDAQDLRIAVDLSDGVASDMEHLGLLRTMVKIAVMRAELSFIAGDEGAITRDLGLAVSMARYIEQEPTLISQLVRTVCSRMVYESIDRMLNFRSLSVEEMNTLSAFLSERDYLAQYRTAMIGERALFISGLEEGLGGQLKRPGDWTELPGLKQVKHAVYDADNEHYLTWLKPTIEASRAGWAPFREAVEQSQENYDPGFSYFRPGSSILIPAMSNLPIVFIRGEAQARILETAIAIERYHQARGTLPDSLEELVPEFLDAVPLDPGSGNPLLYLMRSSGYAVYALGENGVDDSEIWLEDPATGIKSGDYFVLIERPDLAQR